MEASSVTGPAKNLLSFCQWTRSPEAVAVGIVIQLSIATYCRHPDDGSANAFVSAARVANIPINIINERKKLDSGVRPQIMDLVSDLKPNIVQTHNVKSHVLFGSLGVRDKAKWIAFQHGYTATDLKMRLYNQLDRWSLRRADRVVTVCKAFVPRLISYGVDPSRTRVLHNSVTTPVPISANTQNNLRARLGLEPDVHIILSIGRFSREKGQSDLLQALARLRSIEPGSRWKAVFVGNGPDELMLRKLAFSLGLSGHIVFAGFHKDVAPFYAIADILAMPSHSEGSSNVMLEAMAANVAIVATAVGGNPEIVTGQQSALLVPACSPKSMAQALASLLRDNRLRSSLAAAAASRAQETFSQRRYLQSLMEIYHEVLELGPAPIL